MASSQGTDADKSSLRSNYLSARATIPARLRRASDEAIRARLCTLPVFVAAPVVLTYVSVGAEVDTRALIEGLLAEGRRVAVPLTHPAAHEMSFHEIRSLDELRPGAHRIPEPPADAPALAVSDMVRSVCLVPGLVFDGAGHRVGYGGGYYDRFLPFYPGWKVGLARTTQLSSNPLPVGPHDVPVDYIVTEGVSWSCW
ncbi:5-formyltetrahydrofolate cyclo-ligase [Thermophilibacter sp.]